MAFRSTNISRLPPGYPVNPWLLTASSLISGRPLTVRWRTDNDTWHSRLYQTGDIALVPAGGINETSWDTPLHAIIVALNPHFAQQILEDEVILKEVRGHEDKSLFHLALAFKNELQYGQHAAKLQGELLAITTAIHITTKYPASNKTLHAPKGKLSASQLIHVIDYCQAFIDQPITIDVLSHQAHLSPFHFIRMFKNTVGASPYQYLLNTRIEKATQLIRLKKPSLTEIAHQLGFTDLPHFSNSFKKVTGYSPSSFLASKQQ